MKYRIDYHFHGNFSRFEKCAYKKAVCLWQKIKKNNINVLISTEHAYKNPKRAYEILKDTKPENIYLFPGVEYLTKEGVDIVIFAETDFLYDLPELKPREMTFDETINFVLGNEKLFSYVTHPYIPSGTSVIRGVGKMTYQEALEDLQAVEIANSTLDTTICLLEKLPFLDGIAKEMQKVKVFPVSDYPKQIKFLAAGSDSHHCHDIGTCLLVDSEEKDIFKVVTNHSSSDVHYKKDSKWWYIVPSIITTFNEFLIKKIKL